VEGLLRDERIEVKLEGIKVIRERRKGEIGPILVKMRRMEQKKELMIRKRKVREREREREREGERDYDRRRFNLEGKENKIEAGGNSLTRESERREGLGGIWENTDRREMVKMGGEGGDIEKSGWAPIAHIADWLI